MELVIPPGQGQEGDTVELDASAPVLLVAPHPGTESTSAALSLLPAPSHGSNRVTWRDEDTTFPGSDVAISILLFREDGHPEGRLVQIVVKDFHETCASHTYRAKALTRESELDSLQSLGLNEVVQQFWLLLEERRKKAVAEAAKQKSAPPQVAPVPRASASPPPKGRTQTSASPILIPQPSTPPPASRDKRAAAPSQFEFF